MNSNKISKCNMILTQKFSSFCPFLLLNMLDVANVFIKLKRWFFPMQKRKYRVEDLKLSSRKHKEKCI